MPGGGWLFFNKLDIFDDDDIGEEDASRDIKELDVNNIQRFKRTDFVVVGIFLPIFETVDKDAENVGTAVTKIESVDGAFDIWMQVNEVVDGFDLNAIVDEEI